jgi:cytidylate kinase
MKKFTIAIDGYVWTGKGTTAQGVADALGYLYLDTGAMYRAVTLYAKRHNLLDASDKEKVAMMDAIDLAFAYNQDTKHYDMLLNGENVEKEIRNTSLAMDTLKITGVQWVREVLVQRQKIYGEFGGIVADGRDMGTVVFPNAEVKIFLTCDLDTRVERRFAQLERQWLLADKDKIRIEILSRDTNDYLWTNAINKKADDAIVIDTTHCTIQEQIEQILTIVTQKQ